MKIILTTLNAKFIHSSLALRSLKAYAKNFDIKIAEYNINMKKNIIISKLYEERPDILGISCYIWNIDIIVNLIGILKKIMPKTIIIAGGPEASYDPEFMISNGADFVVIGEGEKTFSELLSYLSIHLNTKIIDEKALIPINNIAYLINGSIKYTERSKNVNLSSIPFAYPELNSNEFENRIVYYETSRGCPFSCKYCLSSIKENYIREDVEKENASKDTSKRNISFLPLERVYEDLTRFLNARIKQVKLVDRTFNADKERALKIWDFLIKNYNGVTNFHFEISADLLDNQACTILKKSPVGYFQFEIGVQSTNDITLKNVNRNTIISKLFENVQKISQMLNIHQHLDLIVGLPEESYNSFKKSFNDVFSLWPQQLQLGFLKLLKGSALRFEADKYGIVYQNQAPYEVLFTKNINFDEMLRLKGVENMLNIYYNSGQFLNTLKYIIAKCETPFDFFLNLFLYYKKQDYDLSLHSKIKQYEIIYEFIDLYFNKDEKEVVKELLRFDLFCNENYKNVPSWLERKLSQEEKNSIKQFYTTTKKTSTLLCHIETFEYDIPSWLEGESCKLENKQTVYVLFEYTGSTTIHKALHGKYTKIRLF